MNACPGRAYLRVGVELLDNLLGPALYLSGLRVQAAVQVNTAEVVVWREDEANAAVAVLLARCYGLLVRAPGLGVCATRPKARVRRVGDLRRLALACLGVPAQPLFEVSYVLSVCYHVGILELGGEHSRCAPRLAVSRTGSFRTPSQRCRALRPSALPRAVPSWGGEGRWCRARCGCP